MRCSIGDLREIVGPQVRFTLTLSSDDGDPLLSCEGFTVNAFREVKPPSTKTNRGFWTRFTEITPAFEAQLLQALEGFEEVEKILGPRQERPRSNNRKIVGQREL